MLASRLAQGSPTVAEGSSDIEHTLQVNWWRERTKKRYRQLQDLDPLRRCSTRFKEGRMSYEQRGTFRFGDMMVMLDLVHVVYSFIGTMLVSGTKQ